MDDKLSRREREIMEILYARGEATAAEVRLELDGDPTDATVRTLLRILVQKEIVRQRVDGRKFQYRPKRTKEGAAKLALKRVLTVFYGGSVEKALAVHLEDPKTHLNEQQRAKLIELIEQAANREHKS